MSLLYRDYRPILAFVKCNYRLTLCVFFKIFFFKKRLKQRFINTTIGYGPMF